MRKRGNKFTNSLMSTADDYAVPLDNKRYQGAVKIIIGCQIHQREDGCCHATSLNRFSSSLYIHGYLYNDIIKAVKEFLKTKYGLFLPATPIHFGGEPPSKRKKE